MKTPEKVAALEIAELLAKEVVTVVPRSKGTAGYISPIS